MTDYLPARCGSAACFCLTAKSYVQDGSDDLAVAGTTSIGDVGCEPIQTNESRLFHVAEAD